ncbi:hypothetical protein AMTRI_Chr09g18200 [Amborella trichopoda]|uniref:uncharacterized protein LOC18430383 n=1 Tax=Amborella trichopoda TaxID=13333 RepID=UPI0005D2E5B3|nr:uncharacterized protein LOC18430383 [Amborella trichopoda]|eukprot:XP_011621984.1 uncharacterized protein LOC18430383 [Amborella trichopoda]
MQMHCPTIPGAHNWLDKLRSSKGFPLDNGLNLENFLKSSSPSPNPNFSGDVSPPLLCHSPENSLNLINASGFSATKRDPGAWFDIMTDVLSDLFNMEGSYDFRRLRDSRDRKNGRKQSRPRICALSAEELPNFSARNNADNNSGVGGGSRDDADVDISSCSRTEVTVIDTSIATWKSEKVIYRKAHVWKVRERKGNSCGKGRGGESLVLKKRRLGQNKKGQDGVGISASTECLDDQDRRFQRRQICLASPGRKGRATGLRGRQKDS